MCITVFERTAYMKVNTIVKHISSIPWHSVEAIITLGFQRSHVVMINEAHNGDLRCIRTRMVGQQAIQSAHNAGVRHIAMEALSPKIPELLDEINHTKQLPQQDIERVGYYFKQPDMQVMVQTALTLGWTLIPYEVDINRKPANIAHKDNTDDAVTNWREEQQARNLIAALRQLPDDTKLLVWCGNSHNLKIVIPPSSTDPDCVAWVPMGYQFQQMSGIDPFVIDQTYSVRFPGDASHPGMIARLPEVEEVLVHFSGTAAVLYDDLFPVLKVHEGNDAYIISLDNEME